MRSNYEALNLDLLFLSLIDMKGDTIFNVTRLKEINNELLILEDEHPIEDYKNLEVFIDGSEFYNYRRPIYLYKNFLRR